MKTSHVKLFFFFLLLRVPVWAQQSVNSVPDCVVNFSMSAVAVSSTYGNLQQGCVNWNISYSSTGFSAISLVVQDAPDNAGVPGTWVTFAGTVVSGSNPNTTTTSATTTFTGYYPWMRVSLASKTGTGKVSGTLYGWRNAAGGGGGGGGSTTVSNLLACDNSSNTFLRAAIQFTTATTTQVIAASGSTSIKICSLYYGTSGATNVGLVYGTGSNCGTGTTNVTGTQGFQVNAGLAVERQLALPASQAFCISSSAAVNIGGFVTYVQN